MVCQRRTPGGNVLLSARSISVEPMPTSMMATSDCTRAKLVQLRDGRGLAKASDQPSIRGRVPYKRPWIGLSRDATLPAAGESSGAAGTSWGTSDVLR